ncbi:MAG: 2-oxoacid:acceptor oxidoreductase subunit alpha [Synergistaceae bacterium]|jgi:2-oxoglutarate ferredoxin oxidoreductase subunit alpha|nr:2-oxoacid:acceptor oxidoreductase subunit alpha [Synergistaceae bacterium]
MNTWEIRFAMGNEAIAEGALAAGARFYAGYPITPSSEIAEIASRRLPQVGGVFIQMEDEIASIAAIIGASAAGKKSFTATSGPGVSLMQENLGVAVMSEIPCVIIDVQRSGPSTGLATKPAQGDVMQARWGTHGDHGIIALAPSSVQECYDLTIKAFDFSEKYRTPVYLMADEVIGHMREPYVLHEAAGLVSRKQPDPSEPGGDYKIFDFERYDDHIAPMPPYGGKYIFRMNGSMHDEAGFGCGASDNADKFIRHYEDKITKNRDDIVMTESYNMEDADYVLVSFGCSARSAMAAMRLARQEGEKVGVLKLMTLWPFPDKEVAAALKKAKAAVVPEMNLGQVASEVSRYNERKIPVIGVNRVDGSMITPYQILDALKGLYLKGLSLKGL